MPAIPEFIYLKLEGSKAICENKNWWMGVCVRERMSVSARISIDKHVFKVTSNKSIIKKKSEGCEAGLVMATT